MYLHETLESINESLKKYYGLDISGRQCFRVVYSEEQFEKRLGIYTDYTENGDLIRTVREVREVPKYRQWIQKKYVLEGLTIVPVEDLEELLYQKISYEPIWVFEDKTGNPLPPLFKACQVVLETIRSQMNGSLTVKYKELVDPDEDRLKKLEEELFGNETPVGDALAYGSGVSLANTQKEN